MIFNLGIEKMSFSNKKVRENVYGASRYNFYAVTMMKNMVQRHVVMSNICQETMGNKVKKLFTKGHDVILLQRNDAIALPHVLKTLSIIQLSVRLNAGGNLDHIATRFCFEADVTLTSCPEESQ